MTRAPSALLPVDEALQRLAGAARVVEAVETVPLAEAAKRVLACDQLAPIAVPPLDNSAMDGYAVRSADVREAGTRLPISQRIAAGQVGVPLQAGTAARIFTGAPVPAGADAVVMQEQCAAEDGCVTFHHSPQPGEAIRPAGEDIRRGACVLAAGARLGPAELGLAASLGLAQVPVRARLRVGFFSTGDELTPPGQPLRPGAIYDSNRFLLRAMLNALGVAFSDLGHVSDSLEATRAALGRAAESHDLILTTGGVSVGEEDHVKAAVQAEGRLDLWQIAIKPGKPLAQGALRRADGSEAHFIGLPGNPVSCLVTFAVLVRPFILRCQGASDCNPRSYAMRADFDWPKPDRRREFLRVRVNDAGGLECFPNQSSGVLTSAAWADGLLDNPAMQAIARGDIVRFIPFAELLG